MALVTDIALGATLVSAVITTVFLVTDDAAEVEAPAAAHLEIGPHGGGVRVDGRF